MNIFGLRAHAHERTYTCPVRFGNKTVPRSLSRAANMLPSKFMYVSLLPTARSDLGTSLREPLAHTTRNMRIAHIVRLSVRSAQRNRNHPQHMRIIRVSHLLLARPHCRPAAGELLHRLA